MPTVFEAPVAPTSPAALARERSLRGFLLVVLATVSWSTSGTLIKHIMQAYGVSAWALAFWRDLFTFVMLLSITLMLGAGRLRVGRRDLLGLAAMGAISIGIFHVLWATAVVMIPVATATVLNYTAPAFVALFAWLVWREAPTRKQTWALGLALLGCLLVTGAYNLGNDELNLPGLLIGLSTGVTYAGFTILGKRALRRLDSWTVITYAFGFAALTVGLLRPSVVPELLAMPPAAWGWIALLALVSTVCGFGLYTRGLKDMPATSASIVATFEPALAAGWAFLFLKESIAPMQFLGGGLVIAAVILLAAGNGTRGAAGG